MFDDKTILITGGSGFLGKAMTTYLKEKNVSVVSISSSEVDLREKEETEAFFYELQPDIVLHCAVQGGGIGWMKEHPVESGQDNLRMNVNALEASYLCGAESFIGVSSACVYPKLAKQPYVETEIWQGYPEPFNGPYALSKRMMMDLGRSYAKQYEFHCAFPILANLYGSGDHLSPERAHVVADLMIRCAKDPEYLSVWGTGVAEREFLHVQDAVEGILACLKAPAGEFINIGSGQSTSILELARLIVSSHDLNIPIQLDASKPDGQLKKVLDVKKAKQLLDWEAKIPLIKGLKDTAKWYREQLG